MQFMSLYGNQAPVAVVPNPAEHRRPPPPKSRDLVPVANQSDSIAISSSQEEPADCGISPTACGGLSVKTRHLDS